MKTRRIVAVTIAVPAFLVAIYIICAQARVTSEQVGRRLDRELPNAPTRVEVESWLSSHHCDWNYTANTKSPETPDKFSGAIHAVLHDTDACAAPVKFDIHLVFVFGQDDRVADRLIREEVAVSEN